MDKKDILYFEEDDASRLGNDGKQVFVAKRINGEITHNKVINGKKNELYNNSNKDEELFIEFKTPYHPKEHKPKTKKKKNIPPKNHKHKNTKRKRRGKRLLKLLILIILITGAIVFAMVSPMFNIEKITVQGNEKISTETIISLSGLQIGNNIFQNSKSDVIEKVKENQYIESVQVKRRLPGTMEITVKERTVAYQVKILQGYAYIDYQGYILEIANQKANVPVLEGINTNQDSFLNEKRVVSEDITILNTILKIMGSARNIEIDKLITNITIEKGKEYILYLEKEKKYIYLGDASNVTNKMLYVQTMLKEEKGNSGKILVNGDLSGGFKPYFREE